MCKSKWQTKIDAMRLPHRKYEEITCERQL